MTSTSKTTQKASHESSNMLASINQVLREVATTRVAHAVEELLAGAAPCINPDFLENAITNQILDDMNEPPKISGNNICDCKLLKTAEGFLLECELLPENDKLYVGGNYIDMTQGKSMFPPGRDHEYSPWHVSPHLFHDAGTSSEHE